MHRARWMCSRPSVAPGHWRTTFWVTGLAHSITGGSAYESGPWRAVQRAAWEALNKDGSEIVHRPFISE
jgi:hypothetical protein